MEILAWQTATLKRVSLGNLAPIGPANGVKPRHAKAPRAKNLRSPVKLAVGCTGAFPQVLKHRRARLASQLRIGSTDGGLRPSLRLVNRYGQTCRAVETRMRADGLI